jgi:hypothetical protein
VGRRREGHRRSTGEKKHHQTAQGQTKVRWRGIMGGSSHEILTMRIGAAQKGNRILTNRAQ